MKARGKAASQRGHQMGSDEAPVAIWPLDWCRANSETDPGRSVFVYGECTSTS